MTEEPKTLCPYRNNKTKICMLVERNYCPDQVCVFWEKCHWVKNVPKIHPSVTIYGNVKIGKDVVIKQGTIIYQNATIEDNVTIGHYAIIYENSFLKKDLHIPDFGRVFVDTGTGETVLAHMNWIYIEPNKVEL